MNQLDYLIRDTIEAMRVKGLSRAVSNYVKLYNFTLSNLDQLSNLALFQLSGTLYSIIFFEKILVNTKLPHIAYYCLTRGTTAIQPAGNYDVIRDNWMHSRAERAKLLLKGGLRLIEERVKFVSGMPQQQAYDLSVLGDIIQLEALNYQTTDYWWPRALEDCEWIREKYRKFSDAEIVFMCDNINKQIADHIFNELMDFAKEYGFINK